MGGYALVKTLHILSATILFGTGIGIAFFFWMGGRAGDDRAAHFAARVTVVADLVFTLTAVIAQPLTGAWLIWRGGFDPTEYWLVASYALYLVAAACWLPVLYLQKVIRDQLANKIAGETIDEVLLHRRRRLWFLLGWPAFIALLMVFHLMVTKPV